MKWSIQQICRAYVNQSSKKMTLTHYFWRTCVMCLKIVETDKTWCNAKINFILLTFLKEMYICNIHI